MNAWTYYYVRRNLSPDPDEYNYLRFFRENAVGDVEEALSDGSWVPSSGLSEARELDRRADESEEFLPSWKPFIFEEDPVGFAGMFRLVQEYTGRFSQLPPEGLIDPPSRGPVLWQYFTLTDHGRLISIGRRDVNDPREHNCQFLDENSEWVHSPYLVEYHLGYEHFHDLADITAHEAAVLFKEFENKLANFTAPAEPSLQADDPSSTGHPATPR